MSRQRLIIICIAALLLLFFGVGLMGNRNSRGPAQDRGGDPYVTIKDDKNDLYNFMVYEDYRAVATRLADFVVAEGGKADGTTVVVTDVTLPYRGNGTVTTFLLSVPSLGIKNKLVSVDINNLDNSSFSVQDTGFKVDLYTGTQLK